MTRPHPGEPPAGPWRVAAATEVLALLGHPRFLAVDGRSAGGKTTVAARLAAAVPGATVVHTDDVAWHHSFFDWADLLTDGVLDPVRRGLPVEYRPPAWDERSRPGAITVAAGCPLLIVEGVGVGRRGLAAHFDALLWVQSDAAAARKRGIERDGPGSEAFWDEWEAEELPFLDRERPWERAQVVVCGTPHLAHDPGTELVVGAGTGSR